MRDVAITGIGIVSSIGNNAKEVLKSLRAGTSGISFSLEQAEKGFKSQIFGKPDINLAELIDKRRMRFMGDGAAFCHVALDEAIADAGLEQNQVSHERTGMIIGTGGPSTRAIVAAADATREKGPRRIGPFSVPKAMCSTASATLATYFSILGISFSISSACTTSLHCIGAGVEQIQWGKQDIVLAGGGEELDWTLSSLFDAMGAMSSQYNDQPEKASRAFDKNRDGFVIAGGAGIVVLEALEHAKARGAKIYGVVSGYAATSDGHDMVQPSGIGGERAMRMAIEQAGGRRVDYLNPHATSTPVGDTKELQSIRNVFGADQPHISATKSMTGHCLGGAGAQEAIYSLLMMDNNFVAPSINIEERDEDAADINIAETCIENVELETIMSNSFGFGGTNGTLMISKV